MAPLGSSIFSCQPYGGTICQNFGIAPNSYRFNYDGVRRGPEEYYVNGSHVSEEQLAIGLEQIKSAASMWASARCVNLFLFWTCARTYPECTFNEAGEPIPKLICRDFCEDIKVSRTE